MIPYVEFPVHLFCHEHVQYCAKNEYEQSSVPTQWRYTFILLIVVAIPGLILPDDMEIVKD